MSIINTALLLLAYEEQPSSFTTPAPHIERESFDVSFGEQPFERFGVVHVSAPWSFHPVILSVPLGFTAEWFEGAENYGQGIPGLLAYLGLDVWMVDMRTPTEAVLPEGSCPTVFDCPELGQWTADDLVADLEYIRDEHAGPAILAGHWTGGMLASYAVSQDPDGWDGLALIDGTLHTQEPYTLAATGGACAFLGSAPFSAGPDVLIERAMIQAAATGDPEAVASLNYFFTTTDPLPDRISEGQFFMASEDGVPSISNLDQLFRIEERWSPTYIPYGPFRSLACSFGELPGLASFEGPSLLMCGQLDEECQDTAEALVLSDVSLEIDPEFGVNDYVFSDWLSQWTAFRLAVWAWTS